MALNSNFRRLPAARGKGTGRTLLRRPARPAPPPPPEPPLELPPDEPEDAELRTPPVEAVRPVRRGVLRHIPPADALPGPAAASRPPAAAPPAEPSMAPAPTEAPAGEPPAASGSASPKALPSDPEAPASAPGAVADVNKEADLIAIDALQARVSELEQGLRAAKIRMRKLETALANAKEARDEAQARVATALAALQGKTLPGAPAAAPRPSAD